MSAVEYRFGRCVLSPAMRRLFADGEPLPIGGRALDLLTVLVEQSDRAVTRDELMQRVWPGRIVADDNLKVQILALRKLLGPQAIVTVPRLGYRFGLDVQAAVPPAPAPALAAPGAAAWGAAPRLWGREQDLAGVVEALRAHRLLTIVGTGGIGKTRVAQAVAGRCAADFRDGATLVDLAALSDEADVPSALARQLQLPGDASRIALDAIAAALRSLSVLIVLDNCEHLLAPVGRFAHAVLQAAPQVRLLATSQEPLGVAGEQVVRLPPLGLPRGDESADAATAAQHGAVALFVARARAADPDFVLAPDNVAPVVEICRRLEGIALAIELAAARVPLLGVAGVLARLDSPLKLLSARAPFTAGRHHTMRDALQWSHGLLAAREQAVFRRLGVFVGSFALEAAQVVAGDTGDEWAVIEPLAALAGKSLLQVIGAGNAKRYRLLESARAFALEQLDAAGEAEAVRRRHAEATLAVFERADAVLLGTPMLAWSEQLQPELGNLRAAFAWSLGATGDPAIAIALAGATGSFWNGAGLDAEGGRHLAAVQPLVDEQTPLRRQAQFWLAMANRGSDLSVRATDAFEAAGKAIALFRRTDDVQGLYRSLTVYLQHGLRFAPDIDLDERLEEMRSLEGPDWTPLQRRARRWLVARQWTQRGDYQTYADRMRAETALMNDAGDEGRAWVAAHSVALAEVVLGRPQKAIAALEPAVAAIRARGLARRHWTQIAMLAMAYIHAEDPVRATPRVHEAVGLMQVAGAVWWMSDHLAWWLAQCGAFADAARVQGWADMRSADRGEIQSPQGDAARDAVHRMVGEVMPAQEMKALEAAGARLQDDEVAEIVLGHVNLRDTESHAHPRPDTRT
jgi:predicted ATPase/DNA-binding winged helix-turn-helix (wHTH) protein